MSGRWSYLTILTPCISILLRWKIGLKKGKLDDIYVE